MTYDWLENDDNCLVYIGDTMCSWCYGIAPELDKVVQNNSELPLKVINGGLRPHSSQKIIEMADFIKGHWDEVNKRSGQEFNYGILENSEFIYNTEPASRAVIVARMLNPLIEFNFFKAVQTAFYKENKDTNNIQTYLDIAKEFDLDTVVFEKLFNSEESKSLTQADFELSAKLGITGFPAIVFKIKGEFIQIASGYKESELIENTIQEVIQAKA